VTYRRLPADLPDRLRKAGLKVVVIDGWLTRGRPANTGEFKPVGVLNHHTGSHDPIGDTSNDLSYANWLFKTGRSDLPAPLCQLSISAEGVVYVGASGRANHAGVAKPSGSVSGGDGNALYAGIEWMLSGMQAIPKGMYDAGVKTNAVLLDIFKSSEQTVSCHFQTSVTGKWDIGDPSGVPFNGHKVLNVPKFRAAVKAFRAGSKPKPPSSDLITIDVMHASLQFSDSPAQQEQDIKDLFARAKDRDVWWVTGTESGPGAEPTGELLRKYGPAAGFRTFVPSEGKGAGSTTDCWIAVNKRYIDGKWTQGYETSIPGSRELYMREGIPRAQASSMQPRWGPKGLVRVGFDNDEVGARINVGAGHYLTKDASPEIHGVDHGEWNEVFAGDIGEWAREVGKGYDLVFYGGDQNINDKRRDTFYGSPLTSLQDELKRWENTGHGPIDVLATYDGDSRVTAKYVRALDDKEFFQHSDHFVVEGGVTVRKLAK
jgi:hypothetical protein